MYDEDIKGKEQEVGGFNIPDIISDATSKVMKQLSGVEHRGKKRVIDNVISFIGGSGGVGVSTIVANVAQAIADKNLSVLVIDTNICYPAQHIYFRLKQEIEKKDLITYLSGRCTIGECIEYREELGILRANNRNIMDSVNCDNRIAAKNMEECLDRMSSLFDVVLVDCSHHIEHDIISTVLYKSDAIYCVWDESISCVANFERIRTNMRSMGIDGTKMRVILNKKTSIYYSESVFKKLGVELLEVIPFDTAVIESGLRAEVFIKKGSSTSKTAKEFVKSVTRLSSNVLKLGGYVNG